MTALDRDISRHHRPGDLVVVPVAAAARIRQGSFVEIDDDGRAIAATSGASKRYLGVATLGADNRNGAAGAIGVEVRRRGAFRFEFTGRARVGRLAYLVDDNTVTDTAGTTVCGRIVETEGTTLVWVDIEQRS